jgi:hypothetical protein
MGARRDHDVPGSHDGRPCERRGERPEWGSAACRVCSRSGGGRRPRRRARARCGRAGRRGRESRATRVPVAARRAPGGDSRARPRRPAVAERHLLVSVRLLKARRSTSTAPLAPAGGTPVDAIPPAGSATAPRCGRSSRPLRGTGAPAQSLAWIFGSCCNRPYSLSNWSSRKNGFPSPTAGRSHPRRGYLILVNGTWATT